MSYREFTPRTMCFAEADAADQDVGGAPEAEGADADAELLVEAEGEEEAKPAADELEEVEFDGKKVKVTKGYKDALLRETDYRHKTHEVGQTKKQLEQQAAELRQRAEIQAKFIDEVTEARTLDRQIEQYKALTREQWNELRATDRDRYDDARADYSLLLDKRRELGESINEKVAKVQAEEKRRQSEWAAKQDAEIKTKFKDWSPEKEKTLKAHVSQRFGFDPGELDNSPLFKDPRVIAAVDELHRLHTAIDRAKAKAKAAKEAEQIPVEPVGKVNAGGSVNTNKPSAALVKSNPAAFDRAFEAMMRKRA